MNTLLLIALFQPAELPQVTLRELPQSTVRIREPHYVIRTVARPSGYHEHQCSLCGTRWGHGESSFGKVRDHTCPGCGHLQWDKAFGIKLPLQTVRVQVD